MTAATKFDVDVETIYWRDLFVGGKAQEALTRLRREFGHHR